MATNDEDWVAYLQEKRAVYISAIPLFETGRIGTSTMRDGQIVDTTAEALADARANLAEIEGILAKRGLI